MNCPKCSKETANDAFFCNWCGAYLPNPAIGGKPGFFERFVAFVIDPVIAVVLWVVAMFGFGAINHGLGVFMAVVFPVAYFVFFIMLLRTGVTPGKKVMGLKVINAQTAQMPGLPTMILREIVGRFLSGLFLGLGYFWALFDKSGQAWHDKLAHTVVIKPAAGDVPAPAPAKTV